MEHKFEILTAMLLSAGLLKAMDDGITRQLDPGPPEQRNIYDHMDELKEKYVQLPMSLGEALDAFDESEVVKSALPGEMYPVFMPYKRDEWNKFLATVTDWDLETYLDCLP